MKKLSRTMPQTVSLESSSINQTILQACQQIVRLFFSHIRFDHHADAKIYLEAYYAEGEEPTALTARWVCAREDISWAMERKELDDLWHLGLGWGQRVGKDSLLQIGVKQTLLRLLQKVTGQSVPWGILTGVRPGRLWQELRAMNLTREERREILAKRYLVKEAKIDLLQTVAATEKRILQSWQGSQSVAVYVSIPFCPSRCSYCTFPGYRAQGAMMEAYLKVLGEEISLLAQDIATFGFKVNSIYIGGGTPTALEAGQLMRLLEYLTASLPLEKGVEFCCEAGRPDTLAAEKLAILADAGVNRLCINPQTLNDTTLQRIKRGHSAEDFYKAYELTRRWASWHINADMILGLPGEGETHVMKTTEALVQIALDSITVHYLTLKRGSEMWLSSYESAAANPALWHGGEGLAHIGDRVQRRLLDSGYQPYYMYRQKGMLGNLENVGYSLPGAQSLYNTVMIAESQHIVGLGAGAASKIHTGEHSHRNLFHAKDITVYGTSYREKARIRTELWEKNCMTKGDF